MDINIVSVQENTNTMASVEIGIVKLNCFKVMLHTDTCTSTCMGNLLFSPCKKNIAHLYT